MSYSVCKRDSLSNFLLIKVIDKAGRNGYLYTVRGAWINTLTVEIVVAVFRLIIARTINNRAEYLSVHQDLSFTEDSTVSATVF
jgi:hypothetical protein